MFIEPALQALSTHARRATRVGGGGACTQRHEACRGTCGLSVFCSREGSRAAVFRIGNPDMLNLMSHAFLLGAECPSVTILTANHGTKLEFRVEQNAHPDRMSSGSRSQLRPQSTGDQWHFMAHVTAGVQ